MTRRRSGASRSSQHRPRIGRMSPLPGGRLVLTADVSDIRAVLDRLPALERPIDVRRLEPHTTS